MTKQEHLEAAGQACVDWFNDTGDCHFCNPDENNGRHDEDCPLFPLFAEAGATTEPGARPTQEAKPRGTGIVERAMAIPCPDGHDGPDDACWWTDGEDGEPMFCAPRLREAERPPAAPPQAPFVACCFCESETDCAANGCAQMEQSRQRCTFRDTPKGDPK